MEKEIKEIKEKAWNEKQLESPMDDYYTENLNEEPPHLAYAEFHFRQTPDDLSPLDEQGLTVKCEHAGGEPYFVIETTRWAVNSPEELHALMKEVEAGVSSFLWL